MKDYQIFNLGLIAIIAALIIYTNNNGFLLMLLLGESDGKSE